MDLFDLSPDELATMSIDTLATLPIEGGAEPVPASQYWYVVSLGVYVVGADSLRASTVGAVTLKATPAGNF